MGYFHTLQHLYTAVEDAIAEQHIENPQGSARY